MMARTKKGFTIAELALAMSFLGVLLVTIAMLVSHIISIYQKGMSLKSVNTLGEDLIDDFSRTIAASTPSSLGTYCSMLSSASNLNACNNDTTTAGYKMMYQQRYTNVQITSSKQNVANVPTTGVFCTGRYSYLWNSGYILDDSVYTTTSGGTLKNERATLTLGSGTNRKTYEDYRLLKVEDTEREACKSGIESGSYAAPGKGYTLSNSNARVTEMLEKSEDNLALYDFTVFKPTFHTTTRHSFYSATFILATIRGGVNIMASGDYCTERPDNLNTDFAYCAMNKFNFAARATGENLDEN